MLVKIRGVAGASLELAGLAALVYAGWRLHEVLGIALLGVVLVVLGLALGGRR